MIKPAWFSWAMTQIGTREIVGPEHNPTVVDYWRIGRVALTVRDDETAWCAAFVNAALESTGYAGTQSGRARSFLDTKMFKNCDPHLGAIAVFSSAAGPANGHVGFVDSVSSNHINVLGGNQGNAVSVAPFPRSRLLRLCWPVKAPAALNYPLAPTRKGGTAVSDR